MKIDCPICRKANASEIQCRRCGEDLLPFIHILRCADTALRHGAEYLQTGDGPNALRQAEIAWNLKHTPAAARLAFMACLLQQRFSMATLWYRMETDLENEV
jgi:hypothetical protein